MSSTRRFSALVVATALAGFFAATAPVGRGAPVTACVFSRDGSSLLAARQGEVVVLSTRDGAPDRALKTDLQRVTSLAFCGNGELLVAAGGVPGVSGRVVILEWRSGRVLGSQGGFDDLATSVSASPGGKLLAAGSADRTVQLFAIQDGAERLKPVARLEGHAGPVLCILVGRDGKTVVSGSADRSIKVWDVAGRRVVRTLTNHTSAVHCLARRPTSANARDTSVDSCASGGEDHTVRVWQPLIGRMVRIVRRHEGPVLCAAYAPGGASLYSAGAEGIVRMIDADSDTVVRQWRASDDWVYALAVSPDGRFVATGDWTGTVKLWQINQDTVQLMASCPLPKGH